MSKVIGKSTLRIFKYKFKLSFTLSLIQWHTSQAHVFEKTRLTAVIESKAIRAERRQTNWDTLKKL